MEVSSSAPMRRLRKCEIKESSSVQKELRMAEGEGHKVPPAPPGGHFVGETVYCTDPEPYTFDDGDRLEYGLKGSVVGPADNGDTACVAVLFHGNKGNVNEFLTNLSREVPPALPGGYRVGETVYCTDPEPYTFDDGDRLEYGLKGRVVGPADCEDAGKKVKVLYDENKGNVNEFLTNLSREAPPALPGGYRVGETVYCTDPEPYTFDDGDRTEYGLKGRVVGPADCEDAGKKVKVLYDENKGNVNEFLTNLSRKVPPALLGGYRVGEVIFYTGANVFTNTGDHYEHASQGTVVGPSKEVNFVLVKFPHCRDNMSVHVSHVSREAPVGPVAGSANSTSTPGASAPPAVAPRRDPKPPAQVGHGRGAAGGAAPVAAKAPARQPRARPPTAAWGAHRRGAAIPAPTRPGQPRWR